jgi:hypothetical protein
MNRPLLLSPPTTASGKITHEFLRAGANARRSFAFSPDERLVSSGRRRQPQFLRVDSRSTHCVIRLRLYPSQEWPPSRPDESLQTFTRRFGNQTLRRQDAVARSEGLECARSRCPIGLTGCPGSRERQRREMDFVATAHQVAQTDDLKQKGFLFSG